MNKLKYFGVLTAALLCLIGLVACSSNDNNLPPPHGGDPDPNIEVSYYQQLLCLDITSTGCVSCPIMATTLQTVAAEQPDRLAIVALHMHYGMYEDPMHLAITKLYAERLKASGLPVGFMNISPDLNFTSDRSTVNIAIKKALAENPPICGVAIGSSYEAATRNLSVTAKVTSNRAEKFRYLIFLVEDGVKAWQLGSEEAESYVHNHVVRAVLSNNIYGERMNQGAELEPGKEFTVTRSTTLLETWNPDKMQIVVAALTSEDNGVTWVCNNVRTCDLGKNADYKIEETSDSEE